MSSNTYTTPEVIELDDEEEVEVVFSNINKTHVNRNLLFQKISEEIQLLQAMCGCKVPTEFEQFKRLAKKIGSKFGDDVIHSAWQRVIKKHVRKLTNMTDIPILYDNGNNSSSQASYADTNCNFFVASPPVSDHPSPLTCSVPSFSAASSPALIVPDITHVPHTNSLSCASDYSNSEYITRNCSPNGKETPYPDDAQQGELEKILFTNPLEQVKVTQYEINHKTQLKHSNETFSGNPNHLQIKKKKRNITNMTNISTESSKGKDNSFKKIHINSSDSLINYVDLSFPLLSNNINPKRMYLTRKSVKKIKEDLHKIGKKEDRPSHFGVPAKIIKRKQKPPKGVNKKLYNKMKQMSEAELKEFKAEQKRIKFEQKKEFQMEQLQKIHDRLVDVLIPKYHNKYIS